jgi:membrane-bound lytic murein transglycosylase B
MASIMTATDTSISGIACRLDGQSLKTNGWRASAPFGEGTANFQVMLVWDRSVVYRKTIALFAEG